MKKIVCLSLLFISTVTAPPVFAANDCSSAVRELMSARETGIKGEFGARDALEVANNLGDKALTEAAQKLLGRYVYLRTRKELAADAEVTKHCRD